MIGPSCLDPEGKGHRTPAAVDGKESRIRINGIFTYTVNEEGLLTTLRGYWEPENAEVVPASAQA